MQQVDEIFLMHHQLELEEAMSTCFGILLSLNVENFDWRQSDVLMGLNEKNNLKVTLYFSVINGETLGPFPNWIGKPSLNSIQLEKIDSLKF